MKYTKAWERQTENKKVWADLPDIDELKRITENIYVGKFNSHFQTKRARALFVLYYLTGCRLTEILKTKRLRYERFQSHLELNEKGKNIKVYDIGPDGMRIVDKGYIPHDYMGIRKRDLRFQEIDGKEILHIRTENRKNKSRKTKLQPVPISKEMDLVMILIDYLSYLKDEDYLFNFSGQRAIQLINQTTGFNVHFIRHIRCTHLVTKYDFNEQLLIKFMGWTDSRPAKNYMELNTKDIVRQFYR